ncbi:MAG: hypothetical protein IPL47_12565 [Phyllobacteriaceae bacterium]|nr:hypothetical protein [Phyllobacteriaceae bacterium]
MDDTATYLRAMMSLIARQTFPPEKLAEIVSNVGNAKTFETYNLFDGTRTQTEVAKLIGSDQGLLSRTVKRWFDEGVLVRTNDGSTVKPVHLYPIPDRIVILAKKKLKEPPDGGRRDSPEA